MILLHDLTDRNSNGWLCLVKSLIRVVSFLNINFTCIQRIDSKTLFLDSYLPPNGPICKLLQGNFNNSDTLSNTKQILISFFSYLTGNHVITRRFSPSIKGLCKYCKTSPRNDLIIQNGFNHLIMF